MLVRDLGNLYAAERTLQVWSCGVERYSKSCLRPISQRLIVYSSVKNTVLVFVNNSGRAQVTICS